MDKFGNSILPIEAISNRAIHPHELLQVNIEGLHESHHQSHAYHNYMQSHSVFHPEIHDSNVLGQSHKLMRAGFPDIESDRWRFFGHHHLDPVKSDTSSTSASAVTDSNADKRAKRCMQQRIKRANETAEEKEIRRLKNRELNRRRRANLDEVALSAEKSRNRLRQRVKREISRMIRTGEQREQLIKEKFGDIDNFLPFHPESSETATGLKLIRPGFPETESDRWRFFGQHHNLDISKSQPYNKRNAVISAESDEQRAKRSLQQRIKRDNETMEEKEARRLKNRELNRQRRANMGTEGLSAEKARNRLRQRVKREITRMIKTGEKREDFIKETFADVGNVFTKEETNTLYSKVRETVQYI